MTDINASVTAATSARPRGADPTVVVPVENQGTFWADPDSLLACLREPTPRIPPVFGYDEVGSELFEAITRLPTYYLTRVEWQLLRRHAQDIAARLGAGSFAELGSGSGKKTRVLLAACLRRRRTTYLPIDVSREMLEASAAVLRAELPELVVTALWGRYEAALEWLRTNLATDASARPLVVSFLGSNIGNATDPEREGLLADIATALRPGDGFLFSADLRKPRRVFERCYNDPPGHTAFHDFRLNHLTHLNRRFGADFAIQRFDPRAHYTEATGMVEGHLYARADHSVTVRDLDLTLRIRRGDSINVGFSAKFHPKALAEEVARHGMELEHHWVDPEWRYGIFLARLP
ncbi:MAG TPA: L-histidine N(alpha)-methyltransferase [Pseudonocardia sp.]|jgi:L-histidine N-alpha-methyltransferase|uniref:L-histidine N(alpha)-methyltransferase n=1 Tax=Pseudonocardia sp. TaxID=60912 RepID=UPI002B6242EB|nr:L-histidine N(alpha)-methyltransferase [Pseudonocardia sp.]HTF50200.1 L-histidine N(alpha)-methyltransferase [Pseudonocardia sp.]